MATQVAGQGQTFNLPNYVGELFWVTPTDTPFLSIIGGLTGGRATRSTYFTWQTQDNEAPGQNTKVEGADAVFDSRTRDQFENVVQIHQEGFELSYTKQAAVDQIEGESLLGTQPVQDERAHQLRIKLEKIARDVEYSFLRGTYQRPADNTTARQTRGLQNAISTNAVAAGAADLSKDHVDELLRNMADGGALFRNPVVFTGSYNKQRFSEIYGYAPESRNVGGLNIKVVETDFTPLAIQYNRHMPADEVFVVDVSVTAPVMLQIPGKGHFFVEPLAKTGAADKWQLYGEIGLLYGPEQWHGKVTGTGTG